MVHLVHPDLFGHIGHLEVSHSLLHGIETCLPVTEDSEELSKEVPKVQKKTPPPEGEEIAKPVSRFHIFSLSLN